MEKKDFLIGLSGKPMVGKTQVANYLQSAHNISTHIEMSDRVIAEARLMLSAIGQDYDPTRKADYRLLLQFIGHFRRIEDPDYWLKVIDEVERPATIGGIRYPNEIFKIHSLGGVVWQITRNSASNSDSAPTEIQLDNFSGFDAIICNNSDLATLYQTVDNLIFQLLL